MTNRPEPGSWPDPNCRGKQAGSGGPGPGGNVGSDRESAERIEAGVEGKSEVEPPLWNTWDALRWGIISSPNASEPAEDALKIPAGHHHHAPAAHPTLDPRTMSERSYVAYFRGEEIARLEGSGATLDGFVDQQLRERWKREPLDLSIYEEVRGVLVAVLINGVLTRFSITGEILKQKSPATAPPG